MEYSKGKIVEGKIIHVAEEYLLVKFPNKETGILHKSKMSPQPESDLTDLYRRNQSILVSIDWITEKGYTLGQRDIENRYENQLRHEAKELEKQKKAEEREHMKELVENCASQFIRGGVYEAEVIRLSNQIAKISIDGIDGYIKKDELNWNENDSVKESLFEGETIHAVFLEYTDGKLLFGLKYLEEKPYDDDLYSLSTEELLKRLGHNNNVFIAEAKNIKGICLTNLYSEYGNLLIDPFKGNNIVVKFIQPTIEEGKFYKVRVKLLKEEKRRESNDLFSFYVSNAEEVINPYKSDVDLAFCKHTSPATNSSIANLLDEVGLNMYSSPERMFFELIQNADDAASENGVIINIDKLDNYLVFTHNGFHFSKNDFESIVSAAKSTKTSKEKTGYKGIGFKSVFTNSQQVYVHSGGYHFLFDKNTELYDDFDGFYFKVNKKNTVEEQEDFIRTFQSEKKSFRGVKDIPWQLLPIWYDDVPDSLKKSAFAKNQKVSFALNIKNQKIEDYIKAIEFLFDNPKFILFLRHTNRLDLKFANKTITKDIKDGIVTIKNSFASKRTEELIKIDFEDIPVSNEAFDDKDIDIQIKEITNRQGEKENKFYDNNNQELEDIPDRIASSKTTTISFVANYDNGNISENKGNSLYAYLPMNEHRFRFPFYINADFVLAANRETLLDSPWNYYLLANIGELIVQWVADLADKGERNCLNLLPLQYFDDSTLDVKQLAQSFNSAYRTALESEAFILNHKGELAKQDEILIDKTGLSVIIGAQLFCDVIGTNKALPQIGVNSTILEKRSTFEQIEVVKLSNISSQLSKSELLKQWVKTVSPEQLSQFFEWLKKNKDGCEELVKALPIFEFEDGYKSRSEIQNDTLRIITTEKILPIRDILERLGFYCSVGVFDNQPFFELVDGQKEKDIFEIISGKLPCDTLSVEDKMSLIRVFDEFNGVGDTMISNLVLFNNEIGVPKPLAEMTEYKESYPIWLHPYVLHHDEFSEELSKYLIEESSVFDKIISINYDDIDVPLFDLYQQFDWPGSFTKKLIDKYGPVDTLLDIIEKSDSSTQQYFLSKITRIDLKETEKYDKESFVYRVLKIALSELDDPSAFSYKIYFNDHCIKDFSIKDSVNCEYTANGENKKVTLSLARLLPNYQDQSGLIEKVINLFETKSGLEKFFDAKHKPTAELYGELNTLLGIPHQMYNAWKPSLGNAQQYLFSVFRRKQCWTVLKGMQIQLDKESDEFIVELMELLYSNNIDIATSPFTYHLKNYFTDKFFDCDYVFVAECILERIEKWADDPKKKDYLVRNGVRDVSCDAIRFRQLFLENKSVDELGPLADKDLLSAVEFFANASGYQRPFTGECQKDVLLKLRGNKACKLTAKCNFEKLSSISREWESDEYKEWLENHYPQIFFFDGKLPMDLSYGNDILVQFSEGDYIYDSNKKLLYISRNIELESTLLNIAKEGKSGLDIDDFEELCMKGKVSISKKDIEKRDKTIETLSEENRKKDEIIENLQAKLKAYENGGGSYDREPIPNLPTLTIKRGENQPLSTVEKIDAQLDAQKKLKELYPSWKYPEGFGEGGSYSYFNVIKTNGEIMSIVLKSHRTDAPLHINTNEWDWIMGKKEHKFLFSDDDVFQQDYPIAPAKLFIYTGDDIKELDPKYLIENQSSIALSFSTINLDKEERITAFSDSLHYFNEMSFDFESFNLSNKAKSIKDIYNTNIGIQNNLSDEEAL